VFTDDREFVIEDQRPIILNGIADFVRFADLADRSVFLWMQPVPESKRRGDLAIWEEFDQEYGRLLGALLDAVAGGIRLWPEVQLKTMTRMADFDRWGEAVMCGLGHRAGTFLEAYRIMRYGSACRRQPSIIRGRFNSIALLNELQRTATNCNESERRSNSALRSASLDIPTL
jgi:hypothetical protein